MKRILFATLLALSLPATSFAATPASQASSALSEGVIKRVDKPSGRLTIAHGPLANLNMPAMTMVFKVKDATWLDKLSAGDKIRFLAEELGGTLVITTLQR